MLRPLHVLNRTGRGLFISYEREPARLFNTNLFNYNFKRNKGESTMKELEKTYNPAEIEDRSMRNG